VQDGFADPQQIAGIEGAGVVEHHPLRLDPDLPPGCRVQVADRLRDDVGCLHTDAAGLQSGLRLGQAGVEVAGEGDPAVVFFGLTGTHPQQSREPRSPSR
jgi:hypothetical protein